MMAWSGPAGVRLGVGVGDGLKVGVADGEVIARVYSMVGNGSKVNVGIPVAVCVSVAVNVAVAEAVMLGVGDFTVGKRVREGVKEM